MTKPCDACQSGSAVIYCRADAAFLCSSCDMKVHGANKLASRHERVVMCEVCEHAPATVTCKADAAALCVTCDNDIHSANPLARRHERVAVTPFYESSPSNIPLKFAHRGLQQSEDEEQQCSLLLKDEEEEESSAAEAASWLLPHPNNVNAIKASVEDEGDDVKGGGASDDSTEETNFSDVPVTAMENTTSTGNTNNSANNNSNSTVNTCANFFTSSKLGGGAVKEKLIKSQQNFDLFSDMDPYLDMDFVSALGALHPVTDSLVPIHGTEVLGDSSPVPSNTSGSYDLELQHKSGQHNFCAELSLSTSSIDVGVVPDASLSDISTPQSRPTSIFDLPHDHHLHHQQQQQQHRPAPLQHATPLEPMAREARVLRYREKRKNRKFEKTIRYASRKAYAETRPRIKGRFAKRSEMEVEQMYAVVPDGAFGVVPSY